MKLFAHAKYIAKRRQCIWSKRNVNYSESCFLLKTKTSTQCSAFVAFCTREKWGPNVTTFWNHPVILRQTSAQMSPPSLPPSLLYWITKNSFRVPFFRVAKVSQFLFIPFFQHGNDSKKPLCYSHMDNAGSSGPFPGVPTGAPLVALASHYLKGRLWDGSCISGMWQALVLKPWHLATWSWNLSRQTQS